MTSLGRASSGLTSPRGGGPRPGLIAFGRGKTRLGEVLVAVSDRGVCRLSFLPVPLADPGWVEDSDRLAPILRRIAGHVDRGEPIDDLPLDLRGTPFQLRVWEALRAIPAGTTATYGELAGRLGLGPGAARAVGAACGANPVALLVPCHRVIPAAGGLGGYRWGVERKAALLRLEAEGQSDPGTTWTAVP